MQVVYTAISTITALHHPRKAESSKSALLFQRTSSTVCPFNHSYVRTVHSVSDVIWNTPLVQQTQYPYIFAIKPTHLQIVVFTLQQLSALNTFYLYILHIFLMYLFM